MAQTDFGGTGYGAHCALHPDQPAAGTCTRCGNFMCAQCTQEGAQSVCPTCQQRMGAGSAFPLTRENWNFSALWNYCFEVFKRDWLMISAAVLIFGGISFVVQMMAQLLPAVGTLLESQVLTVVLSIAAAIVQTVVQGLLGLGLMRMLIEVLQGQRANIERLFSQFHKVWTYLLTTLLVVLISIVPIGAIAGIVAGIIYFVGSEAAPFIAIGAGVLVLIPLIYFLLPLVFLQPEMAMRDDAPSPMELLRRCYAYAQGERPSIFGVMFVQGLVVLAGVLACCVGAIPASGMAYLLTAGLYLALSTGENVER
ncbi:RING finger protein [Hyalangium rubrum]|uniref:Zinc finger, RING-type domain-containing protein n=1 Tax=Hyalangium rubrum TaxID=3103134 RepID=A0ABU5GYB2_9BACT|nr:zinc finger, RING-type domain-containing protein [Hyalangium sp. s54d21]MDY7226193.1 zinc finger, RING-type domain-containing protein [Hyalangium sp. s54d21]